MPINKEGVEKDRTQWRAQGVLKEPHGRGSTQKLELEKTAKRSVASP
jgi:hypothetical protein